MINREWHSILFDIWLECRENIGWPQILECMPGDDDREYFEMLDQLNKR